MAHGEEHGDGHGEAHREVHGEANLDGHEEGHACGTGGSAATALTLVLAWLTPAAVHVGG